MKFMIEPAPFLLTRTGEVYSPVRSGISCSRSRFRQRDRRFRRRTAAGESAGSSCCHRRIRSCCRRSRRAEAGSRSGNCSCCRRQIPFRFHIRCHIRIRSSLPLNHSFFKSSALVLQCIICGSVKTVTEISETDQGFENTVEIQRAVSPFPVGIVESGIPPRAPVQQVFQFRV